MTGGEAFLRAAGARYDAINVAALEWMLDRPTLHGFCLNTKLNAISLKESGAEEGPRGAGYTYGWIQGRGLEALATFGKSVATENPVLGARIDAAGQKLYAGLADLQAKDGHAYFCYDTDFRPVWFGSDAKPVVQKTPADIYTYADAFVAKGLVAGAARYAPDDVRKHLDYLKRVILSIEEGRFQLKEQCALEEQELARQADDFGPRMILMSAVPLLASLGLENHTGFADPFILHVLDRHYDEKSGLLRNVARQDEVNVGHGVEFVGFALDHARRHAVPGLITQLERVLAASFQAGFVGPGIALSVSANSGKVLNPYCPWWSLPETIRAAALAYEMTGSGDMLQIWTKAHAAFFENYWRDIPPVAYQTLTKDGPRDFVPATPDLDPLYHTGLSLLAASKVAYACAGQSPFQSNTTEQHHGFN